MENKKLKALETINRALGVIEGVMLLSDKKITDTLEMAVSMIDEALKEVLEDGKTAD